MARAKIAYKKAKKPQNRLSILLVSMVVLILAGVVAVKSQELKSKQAANQAREQALEEQIAREEARTEEIAEYEKYTQTKKYVEEVAKDKLGLVYEGEIVFQEE